MTKVRPHRQKFGCTTLYNKAVQHKTSCGSDDMRFATDREPLNVGPLQKKFVRHMISQRCSVLSRCNLNVFSSCFTGHAQTTLFFSEIRSCSGTLFILHSTDPVYVVYQCIFS